MKISLNIYFFLFKNKIISFDDCNSVNTTLSKPNLELCDSNLDVLSYLHKNSHDDYSDYCLGFTFTARDFKDGTLGLAWLAEETDTFGGACKNTRMTWSKSYNSGIVTVRNYK